MGLNVGRGLKLNLQSLQNTVPDYSEHSLTLLTVEFSGSVRMENPTNTTVLQDWLMIRFPGDVGGLTRCPNVLPRMWLLMMMVVSSSAQQCHPLEFSRNMLTLPTAGSTSSV